MRVATAVLNRKTPSYKGARSTRAPASNIKAEDTQETGRCVKIAMNRVHRREKSHMHAPKYDLVTNGSILAFFSHFKMTCFNSGEYV